MEEDKKILIKDLYGKDILKVKDPAMTDDLDVVYKDKILFSNIKKYLDLKI